MAGSDHDAPGLGYAEEQADTLERADGGWRHFCVPRRISPTTATLRLARDTAVPTLNLITCYPSDAVNSGGPLRYVVVAEAV
jgi:hypothetical protein